MSEQPEIDFQIDPGNASVEVVQEVLDSLSELHVAMGGSGLLFTVDGTELVAREVTDADLREMA